MTKKSNTVLVAPRIESDEIQMKTLIKVRYLHLYMENIFSLVQDLTVCIKSYVPVSIQSAWERLR